MIELNFSFIYILATGVVSVLNTAVSADGYKLIKMKIFWIHLNDWEFLFQFRTLTNITGSATAISPEEPGKFNYT